MGRPNPDPADDRRRDVIIIGIGNASCGDDAIGLITAGRVKTRRPHLPVVSHDGDPLDLCELWRGADAAIVVDAVYSTQREGTIERYQIDEGERFGGRLRGSTHGFGLAEAVDLSRAVGTLPPQVVVYGVVGSRFAVGDRLSPAVESVVDTVVERILRECDEHAANALEGHRRA